MSSVLGYYYILEVSSVIYPSAQDVCDFIKFPSIISQPKPKLSENIRVLVLQWRHVKPVHADHRGITAMEADFPSIRSVTLAGPLPGVDPLSLSLSCTCEGLSDAG